MRKEDDEMRAVGIDSVRTRCFLAVACFLLLAAAGHSEVETDIVTASNMVRQTQSGGTNYFMGQVGIGRTPARTLDVEGGTRIDGNLEVESGHWINADGDTRDGISVANSGNIHRQHWCRVSTFNIWVDRNGAAW